MQGWSRLDDPTRGKGGRLIVRQRTQNNAERAAGGGCKRKTSHDYLLDRTHADFADDRTDHPTAQCFFHGPQRIPGMRSCDRDQPFRSNACLIETGPIGDTIFKKREIVGNPKHCSICGCHSLCGATGRAPIRKAAGLAEQTCCDREGKGGSGRRLRLPSGRDLVQSAACKTASERSIDHPDAKLDASPAFPGKPGCPLDQG